MGGGGLKPAQSERLVGWLSSESERDRRRQAAMRGLAGGWVIRPHQVLSLVIDQRPPPGCSRVAAVTRRP